MTIYYKEVSPTREFIYYFKVVNGILIQEFIKYGDTLLEELRRLNRDFYPLDWPWIRTEITEEEFKRDIVRIKLELE